MRQSAGFFPTLRELPKDAECPSHILMLRAGLIRQLAAGLYTYLPLGRRALRNVEEIIRREMDRAGAIEVLMPALQPDSLWKESGRWDVMGPELMRIKDRNEREFVLGPTHEEVITTLVANEIRSYRDLPKNLYQIQTKFRDEVRPRFGVIRSREFIMKDGYSFDCDLEGARRSYRIMYEAYDAAFKRCGLHPIPVEADTGAMGGSESHEFMVPAEVGEAQVALCSSCGYQSNREIAESALAPSVASSDPVPPIEEIHTPDLKTVEDVAAFVQCTPGQMIKTMVFTSGGKPFVILLRGDHTVNEIKVARAVGAPVELASPDVIEQVTRAPVGFAGPVGLQGGDVWADHYVKSIASGVTGANRADYHLRHVVLDRDYHVDRWGDFRSVDAGDPCPSCGQPLALQFGIEVGQVFLLGTKYSQSLKALYTDENGERQHMVMGCYGIGVSRTLAAVIEEHHDEHGIIFPVSVAPYHVHLLNLSPRHETMNTVSDDLCRRLEEAGLEVLLDDRDERPGIKFKDADLLGLPYRVVVGEKSWQQGQVEFLRRRDLQKHVAPPYACQSTLMEWFGQDKQELGW